jgi:hypothetical protein
MENHARHFDTFVQNDQAVHATLSAMRQCVSQITSTIENFQMTTGNEVPVVQEIVEEIESRIDDDPNELLLALDVCWEKEMTPAFVFAAGQWWIFAGIDDETRGLKFESLEA